MVNVNAQVASVTGTAGTANLDIGGGQVSTDVTVEWDFDNDGDYDETVEDITGYVTSGQYRVGRDYPSQQLGRSTPGTLRLVLNNADDRFGPYNTSSALNTDPFTLKSGRQIRLRTTESAPVEPAELARDRMAGSGDIGSTENGLTWTVQTGGWTRSGGLLTPTSSGVNIATVDVDATDYYLQIRFEHVDKNKVGIVYRFTDTSNYQFVSMESFNTVRQTTIVSGTPSDSSTLEDHTSNQALGVHLSGAAYAIYLDGVAVHTGSTATSAAELVGVYVDWQSQRAPSIHEFFAWDTIRSVQDGPLWTGTVTSVEAEVDQQGKKVAIVFAEGDLARLDRAVAAPQSVGTAESISVGSGPGKMVGNVLGRVGVLHPPYPLDAGTDLLGAVALGPGKGINLARRFEEAEQGFLFERAEGGIGFDDRGRRDGATTAAVFSDSPAAAETGPELIRVKSSHRDIVNQVTSEVSPTVPSLKLGFTATANTAAASSADVSVPIPNQAPHSDDAEVGDLAILVAVSTVQTDGVPWLNPVGWTNLRPTFDELGLTRIYAKRLEAGDFGNTVLFYDDTTPAGGAWHTKLFLIRNWHGIVQTGVSIAGPVGYGLPHTQTQANAGTNDPPALLTPWGPSPNLYLAFRTGMVSSAGGATVAATDDANAPHGFHSQGSVFVDATAGGDYDIGMQQAIRYASEDISNPTPFTGDFDDFDYVESFTIAVRPYAGDPPPQSGGIQVTSNNVASQNDHRGVVPHRTPADVLADTTKAAAYNNRLLSAFDQDRPIVTVGYHANKTWAHRRQARIRRLSDRVTITANGPTGQGIDEDFFIETIRGRLSDGNRRWWVEYDCSPVATLGGGADDVAIGYLINQPWPIDTFTAPTVTTGTNGVEYEIDTPATGQSDFDDAIADIAADSNVGGHVIRFTGSGNTFNGQWRVRGNFIGGTVDYSGATGNHNTITCDPGVTLTQVGGAGGYPTISIEATSYWDVVNCNFDTSDFQHIRYMYVYGDSGSICQIVGNTMTNAEHSHIKVRGWFESPWTKSQWINVEGNVIDGGTISRPDGPEFSEGIYVGHGGTEWVDTTSDVTIAKNLIRNCTSDSIETKVGSDVIDIEDNVIHSGALVAGSGGTSIPVGHLTVHYANTSEPGGDNAITVNVRRNRIYDMQQATGTVRPPIIIGRGGATVNSNLVWGCEDTVAVEINSGSGGMGTGTINAAHNTTDAATCVDNVDSYGSLTEENNVPDDFDETFVGPTTGDADAGQGAGSGFALTSGQGTVVSGTSYNDATDSAPNSPADPGALAAVN